MTFWLSGEARTGIFSQVHKPIAVENGKVAGAVMFSPIRGKSGIGLPDAVNITFSIFSNITLQQIAEQSVLLTRKMITDHHQIDIGKDLEALATFAGRYSSSHSLRLVVGVRQIRWRMLTVDIGEENVLFYCCVLLDDIDKVKSLWFSRAKTWNKAVARGAALVAQPAPLFQLFCRFAQAKKKKQKDIMTHSLYNAFLWLMIAFIGLCRSHIGGGDAVTVRIPTVIRAYQPSVPKPSWHLTLSRDMNCMDSFRQQLEKRETWKLKEHRTSAQQTKMKVSKWGWPVLLSDPSFPWPMLATSPTSSLRQGKHCSVSAAGVRQRDQAGQERVSTAVVWSGMKFLPADRSSAWGRCFSPQSRVQKWIHSLAPSSSHCWLFIDHRKLKIWS